ncbi:MAG: serine/threonine protein kinase [Myxococcales bacterium]|nr:serine/threonine protein kinase [Myxococcales bacterium]
MATPVTKDRRVGTRVGKYLLESIIGLGGMATVYAVADDRGARFAMKVLHRPLTADDVAVARFFEEAYLANSVKHPGVCVVIDDGVSEADRCPYLVMELLAGQTLEDRLAEEGCLTIGESLDIAIALADTLSQVHGAGIVHRDLKPPNVFLTAAGVKLLDFGVGKSRAIAMKTAAGTLLGTPAYMAPEQAQGASVVDGRADVFSLGAVLFQCLVGERVHEGQDDYSAWFAAATQPARSLAVPAPEAPPALVTLVDKALAYDREQRWPTAGELRVEALRVRAALSDEQAQSRRRAAPDGSFIRMLDDLLVPSLREPKG